MGQMRACADDIGGALKGILALVYLFPIFECAEEVAGLTLKPPKCVIIPLRPFSLQLVENIKIWLERHIPKWSKFQIKPTSKYLGFFVGPAASTQQWDDAGKKWVNRSNEIASLKLAAAMTVLQYNSKAVTVLGYLGQLLFMPDKLRKKEATIISRLLHAPQHMFGTDFPFKLDAAGSIPFTSVQSYTLAALYRAAHKTLVGWEDMYVKLHSTSQERLPIALTAKGILCPPFWDSPPIVQNLMDAKKGFQCLGAKGVVLNENLQAAACRVQSQAEIYKCILPALHPSAPHADVCKRLCKLLPQHELQLRSIDFEALVTCLCNLNRSHIAMCVLKTWCNGWVTSERMHHDVRPSCIFGCPGQKDNLQHYVQCCYLWNPIFTNMRVPGVDSPLARLAIINPSKSSFVAIAVAFTVYHAQRGLPLPRNPTSTAEAVKASVLWLT